MFAPLCYDQSTRCQENCRHVALMTNRWSPLLLFSTVLALSSCAFGASPGTGNASTGSPAAGRSEAGCAVAPDWLIAVLQGALVVREATLSNVYVLPATGLSSGPPEVQTEAFASAWWVAGMISGVGVRPEIAVWLTNRTSEDREGEILSVDAAAQRYSDWPVDRTQPIRGAGIAEARACVGPIPES
jgi:hypothetical protein